MKALKYVAAHLLWLVNALFGIWLWVISRNAWLAAFDQYYIHGSPTRAVRAGLLDRVFGIILGLAWFVMVIAVEAYFKKGAARGDLPRRFAKATGPIALATFGVDLILMVIQGVTQIGWLRLVVLLVELGLGIAMVWLGWFRLGARKPADPVSDLR